MNTSLTILRRVVAFGSGVRRSNHRVLGRGSFPLVNSRSSCPGTVSPRRRKGVFIVRAMSGEASAPPKFTNALAKEESPYLLQHAHNPVDWLPWGSEAFKKAKDEDKPIFLSVGYSTCHWCHVMEHESFEDESTAELLNEKFVSVKVDREERPDVDKVYMTYIQAISGRGGWPMTVFLTPDLKPIYGGTYFPGKESYGMPSFKKVLNSVADAWSQQRDVILQQGEEVMAELSKAVVPDKVENEEHVGLAKFSMDGCAETLGKNFDSALGGFSGAPKFPRPCEINVLLRQYLRKKDENPEEANGILHMVEYTLERMANGGMYDHLGGGFHRYSVDEHWHVPHFEKMLYDNPQIALTYLNAFQITGEKQWSTVVRGILDYLRRDMTHPEGGLFSAEDADSVDRVTGKKGEGRFYIWTAKEIDEALQGLEVTAFKEHYYVKPGGNCDLSERSDPHKEFVGENCLIAMQSIKETAADMNVSVKEAENFLGECRKLLHEKRGQRQRPGLDDKIVSAWNGMGISALALASRVLANKDPSVEPCFPIDGVGPGTYLEAARKVARFVQSKLWDSSKGLLRRSFCREPSAVEGFADDYALVIAGMLDLYETTGELEWLQFGLKLQAKMDELFWDEDGGGYFSTNGSDPSILLRMKEDYDGAEPTASSVALQNLLRLAALFSDDTYHQKAIRTLKAFSGRIRPLPIALPHMAASSYMVDKWPIRQVVVAGASSMPETQTLLDAVHGTFTPDKVVVVIDTSDKESVSFWREKNPAAAAVANASLEDPDAAPTVFVCQNFSCQAPTSDPEKVAELLSKGKVEKRPQAVDIDFLMKKSTE